MAEESIVKFRKYVNNLPPGLVEKTNKEVVEELLASCWSDLDGSSEGGMAGHKLQKRTEDLSWNPPELTFSIERHGGTVRGSTFAEMQHWSVDVVSDVARKGDSGRRVVGNRAVPLDVNGMVREVIHLVTNHEDDPRLDWQGDKRVRIVIGKILPSSSAVRQTLQGRRKRFGHELAIRMNDLGWEKVSQTHPHTYHLRERAGQEK